MFAQPTKPATHIAARLAAFQLLRIFVSSVLG
jgi:hypothetical protein